MKLRAADWQPIYGAVLTAPCGIETGALVIDGTVAAEGTHESLMNDARYRSLVERGMAIL